LSAASGVTTVLSLARVRKDYNHHDSKTDVDMENPRVKEVIKKCVQSPQRKNNQVCRLCSDMAEGFRKQIKVKLEYAALTALYSALVELRERIVLSLETTARGYWIVGLEGGVERWSLSRPL